MKGPELLEQHVGKLVTSMGAWFPGVRVVFRGYDLHASLKSLSWLELYLFSITGRRYTPQQMEVVQALWCTTSFPEPRLWNNRVAALAGTARSTGILGITAALAVSEAKIYGGIAEQRASDFIISAKKFVDAGGDLQEFVRTELKQKRGIAGYGRPITPVDERISPVMEVVNKQGLESGAHLKLAFEVEKILFEGRWRMQMNIVGLSSALCADMGMSPRDYYFSCMIVFLGGMPPCYLDAADKPEGQLFPLPCRMLSYDGVTRRQWQAAKQVTPANE